MAEYNFENFKSALALLNEAISQSDNHQQAAFYLAKKQDNQFFDFIFMNYLGGIENQITEGVDEMMGTFDPATDEEE